MSVLKIEPYATNNTANFVFNGLTVTSNISSGNANLGNTVTANYYYGNGVNLTGIAATNSNFANYAGNVTGASQSNITSVGTLSGLTVSGTSTLTGNVAISGNLSVTGNTTYVNSNVSVIVDPVIELGSGANGAALSSNDSMDRGTLLHYYTSTTVDAFMGWKSANSEFTFASNASVTNNVATINTLGNIRAGNAILGNSVTSNYFVGSGNNLSNIQASNITGTIANANYSAYVANVVNASQSNITSVGTLNSVTANGVVNLTGASNVALGPIVNVHITGGTIGQYLQTDGSGILSWATISTSGSSISNGNSNLTIPSANGNVNISAVGVANVLVVTGTGANITGTANISGNANVGNIGATGVVATTLAGSLTTAAQPNVTSLGTLSNITVQGNAIIVGNLVVTGNTTYINSNVTQIQDPVIELGGGANGNALNSNDNMDRGTLLHYYTSAPVDAFMGWKTANSEFTFASNASVTNNVATINSLGNIRAGNANLGNTVTSNYFVGNGSLLTGLVATSATSLIAGNSNVTLTPNANINMSVAGSSNVVIVTGTGINISGYTTITGNITSANANLGNIVNANYFSGNGSLLTGLVATSATSLIAGNSNVTLTPNANINMSVAGSSNVVIVTGTGINISGYTTITGNITSANANLGNIVNANYFSGNGSLLTGISTMSNGNSNITIALNSTVSISAGGGYQILYVSNTGANVSGTFGVSGTATVNNFYSNGVANITGTLYSSNANLGNLASANYFNGTLTSLSGAQPNITSVGSLTSLIVTGNLTSNNANLGNLAKANYFQGDGSLLTNIGAPNVIFSGNSNVNVPTANGNVTVTVTGNANIAVFTGTGANINGYLTVNGNLTATNANLGNLAVANYLTVNSNIISGNANLGNLVTSNYFTGILTNGNSNVTITNNSNIGFGVAGNSNVLVVTGSGANITGTLNVSGNLISGNLISGNANLGNLAVANYVQGTLTTQNQPNIVSVGTLLNVIVSNFANVGGNLFVGNISSNVTIANTGAIIATGNITSANANLGNLVTANYTTAVLTTSAQPNITSIGTLGNLIVTNNVSANVLTTGSGSNANLTIDPDGTGNLIISNTTPVVMSNTLTSNGNIIFSGANITLGPAGNVHISGGTTNQYLKTDGSGNLSWGTPSGGGGGTSLTYTAASTPPGSANIADQWYNTSSNTLYEYISDGTSSYWVDIQTPTVSSTVSLTYLNRSYTGDGTTVNFNVTSGSTVNNVLVYVAGLAKMPTTDYTITGTTLTFVSAPIGSAVIMIRELPR